MLDSFFILIDLFICDVTYLSAAVCTVYIILPFFLTATETQASAEESSDSSDNRWLFIGIGAGFIVFFIICLVMGKRAKDKRRVRMLLGGGMAGSHQSIGSMGSMGSGTGSIGSVVSGGSAASWGSGF